MVIFKTITVLPNLAQGDSGGFDLAWEISGVNNFSPTYQVYMAPTESGPWTAQLNAPTADSFALGLGTVLFNQQALFWFKVEVRNGGTVVATSPPVDHRNRMERRNYLRYREMLRRLRLQLNKTQCQQGWLLRRKIYGTRCPICCDETIGTPSSSRCSTCFGTGLVGGYYTPIEMQADWNAGSTPRVSNSTKDTEAGPAQVQKSRIHLFPIPEAKTKDVWVDRGTRYFYEIEAHTPSSFAGNPIRQILDLTRMPTQHPVYGVTLP